MSCIFFLRAMAIRLQSCGCSEWKDEEGEGQEAEEEEKKKHYICPATQLPLQTGEADVVKQR